MPIGSCRLCLEHNVELCDSHFIPRAFYKVMRDEDPDKSGPVLASTDISMLSTKQAHDHLLCAVCEDRFNKNGEKWVIENCWHSPTDFPLREGLIAHGPGVGSEGDFIVFEGALVPQVDRSKLVYFGASMCWRAGAHQWRMPGGDPIRIRLGPYEEELRLYLLGRADFPANAVMLVTVSTAMDPINNKLVTAPWLYLHEAKYRQFKFIVPGITYQLFTGKEHVQGLRAMCTARSPQGFIYMVDRTDEINLHGHLKLVAGSRKVGRLARSR